MKKIIKINSDFSHNIDRSKTQEWKTDPQSLIENFNINIQPRTKIINSTIADSEFGTPIPIVKAIIERAKLATFSYTYLPDEFYNAIIHWYKENQQVGLTKDQILFGNGTIASLKAIVENLTRKHDKVMINVPTYGQFVDVIKNSGRIPVLNELVWNKNNRYEINLDQFEKQIVEQQVTCFIFCSPHNPGGSVWSKETIIQMLAICRQHQVLIISDEVHSDLVLNNKSFCSLIAVATDDDLVIVANSPNKAFNLGGLNNSYWVIKNQVLKAKVQVVFKQSYLNHANSFTTPVIVSAYTDSKVKEWLAEFKNLLSRNYELIKSELKDFKNLQILELDASFLIWAKVNNIDSETFFKKAESYGVFFSWGSNYVKADPGSFRISIACDEATIIKMCKVLKEILS